MVPGSITNIPAISVGAAGVKELSCSRTHLHHVNTCNTSGPTA